MKIEFERDGIELTTGAILEICYLERLGLKNEGDTCKCVVTYEGSYLAVKIEKAEEGDIK
jgi:hypothetical protein